MLPLCRDQGVGLLPYSPLARGLLARAADPRAPTARAAEEGRDLSDTDAGVVRALAEIASTRGIPPARVALAWVLGRQGVSAPIVGATKVGQVDDAVAAVDLTLTDEEVAALEAPYLPHEPFGY